MSPRLPADKHDLAAVAAIEDDPEAAAALLPGLLEWTQDANWPVARALAPVLPRLGPPLGPALAAVLRSDDADWKWHALALLGRHLTPEQFEAVRPEVEGLVARPTEAERRESLPELARELLHARRAV